MQVFVVEAVPDLRERAEHFDSPAADGLALGVEIALADADKVEKIGNAHVAVKLKLARRALKYLLLDLVRVVPNFAHELLEHVLHRQYAERAAVLVGDDGEVLLCLSQLGKYRGQLHGLVHIAGLHQQTADIGHLLAGKRLEEVVEIQNADDIVNAVLVNGDARVGRGVDDAQLFRRVLVNVERNDVNACGHDLACHDVGKINGCLNELGALLVEHVLVLGGLDDGGKLLNGGLLVLLVLLALESERQQLHQPHNEADERHEQDRQSAHEVGVGLRKAVRAALCDDLRDGLAEDYDEHGYNEGRYPRIALVAVKYFEHEQRAEGGVCDVDKIVADENRGERVVEFIDYLQRDSGLFRAVLVPALKTHTVAA